MILLIVYISLLSSFIMVNEKVREIEKNKTQLEKVTNVDKAHIKGSIPHD